MHAYKCIWTSMNIDSKLSCYQLISLGVYQLKMCPSYVDEFAGGYNNIQLFKETNDIVRVRLQSWHTSSKTYFVWIQYDSDHVVAWYYKCRAGARILGTCSHAAAVVWYLGREHASSLEFGTKDWSMLVMQLMFKNLYIPLIPMKASLKNDHMFIL